MFKSDWIDTAQAQFLKNKINLKENSGLDWKNDFADYLKKTISSIEGSKEDFWNLDRERSYADELFKKLVPQDSPFANVQMPVLLEAFEIVCKKFDITGHETNINNIYFNCLLIISKKMKESVNFYNFSKDIGLSEYSNLGQYASALIKKCECCRGSIIDYNIYNKDIHYIIESPVCLLPLL